jgi:hypothetical protein
MSIASAPKPACVFDGEEIERGGREKKRDVRETLVERFKSLSEGWWILARPDGASAGNQFTRRLSTSRFNLDFDHTVQHKNSTIEHSQLREIELKKGSFVRER